MLVRRIEEVKLQNKKRGDDMEEEFGPVDEGAKQYKKISSGQQLNLLCHVLLLSCKVVILL